MWTTPSTYPIERALQERMQDPRSFGGENWDEVGEKLERAKADIRANKEMIALYPDAPDVCGNPRCGMPVAAGTGHCPCKQDMQYCSKKCQKMDRERHSKKCTVKTKKKKMPIKTGPLTREEIEKGARQLAALFGSPANRERDVQALMTGAPAAASAEKEQPEKTEKSIPDKAKGAAAAAEKEQQRLCSRCDKDTSTEGLQYTNQTERQEAARLQSMHRRMVR